MTREEAIELIHDIQTDAVYSILPEEKEALDMAISALSAQNEAMTEEELAEFKKELANAVPEREKRKICKDCNLCQVTDLKDWSATCNNPNSKKYLNFVEKYESCDIPEREKGEWIEVVTGKFPNGEKQMWHYECSTCSTGEPPCPINKEHWDFCPNCGADMRGE